MKKSNIIVQSKIIPVTALNNNDIIPLGDMASIIGVEPSSWMNKPSRTLNTNLVGKNIVFATPVSSANVGIGPYVSIDESPYPALNYNQAI